MQKITKYLLFPFFLGEEPYILWRTIKILSDWKSKDSSGQIDCTTLNLKSKRYHKISKKKK